VIWQIVVFQTDYGEIGLFKNQLWRHFSDIIVITLPKKVTKLTWQIFFHFGPLPIKISGYVNAHHIVTTLLYRTKQVTTTESVVFYDYLSVTRCNMSLCALLKSIFYLFRCYFSLLQYYNTYTIRYRK